jgi:ribosomal protein S13
MWLTAQQVRSYRGVRLLSDDLAVAGTTTRENGHANTASRLTIRILSPPSHQRAVQVYL